MWLTRVFLVPIFAVIAEDRTIFINLVPRDYVDPRSSPDFVCGVNKIVDGERLIAEQNSKYIMEYLDKTMDPADGYRTQVFDVVAFRKDGQAERMLNTFQCRENKAETGLTSFFLAPPQSQCNSLTFEDAKNTDGYFPVYVGLTIDTATIEEFISDALALQEFYHGSLPKLCGTKQDMTNETASARVETLTLLFNFKYNHGKKRNLDPTAWKVCESAEETLEAMLKADLFDVDPEMSFEREDQTVSEAENYVRADMKREGPLTKKAVGFVATSFTNSGGPYSPAGVEDIVTYKGPVVFKSNEEHSSILIRIKEDSEAEEMEYFLVNIQKLSEMKEKRRRKRSPVRDAGKGKGKDQDIGKGKGKGKGIDGGIGKGTGKDQGKGKGKDQGMRKGKGKGKGNPGNQNTGVIIVSNDPAKEPPTPPFKCIDEKKGIWHWTTENKNHEFKQDPRLQSPILFYELLTKKQEDKLKIEPQNTPAHLSWNNRCFKKSKDDFDKLQSMGGWQSADSVAEKLTKVSIMILDRVAWHGRQEKEIVHCPNMMSQTVSIAMMKPAGEDRKPDIYIAGNLENSFQLDQTKNVILDILKNHLPGLYKDVYVMNSRATTFGRDGDSHNHAEMQLAKCAQTNGLKVEALGVSKPPCCACNIVLRNVFEETSKDLSTKAFYEPVEYHEILQDVPVASGKGSDRCERKVNGGKEEHWCGSQFAKMKDGNLDLNGFWRHPIDKGFIQNDRMKIKSEEEQTQQQPQQQPQQKAQARPEQQQQPQPQDKEIGKTRARGIN